MKRLSGSLLLGLGSFLLVGCTQTGSLREAWDMSMASMKPSTGDYADNIEEMDEGWEREVGIEARGDRPMERDNDPFRDMLMSPKARSIERNLGIE